MFPGKIPKHVAGCTLILGALGPAPYVVKENTSSEDFKLTGFGMHLLLIFASDMNFTVKFVEPTVHIDTDSLTNQLVALQSGAVDIMAGAVPLVIPLIDFIDLSIPVLFDSILYLIPCPRALAKMDEIMTLFTLSTWMCMGVVLILVSSLMWIFSNIPANRNECSGYRVLPQCFSSAWAVLLGVSVPALLVSSGMRCLFIIYVWYCFGISTVFQAFFTTYLVESGYETPMDSLDDYCEWY